MSIPSLGRVTSERRRKRLRLLFLPVWCSLAGCASFMEDLENGTILQMAQTGVAVMAEGARTPNRTSPPPPRVPTSPLAAQAKPSPSPALPATASSPPAPRPPARDTQRSRDPRTAAAPARQEAARSPSQQRPAAPAAGARREAVAKPPPQRSPSVTEDPEKKKEDFLRLVASGVRMRALTCPGGDGQVFATGTRPRPRPEVVSCIDVHYRARCDRSDAYIPGVARNFTGSAGCYGDTYAIKPKPACAPERVRIEVVQARPCGD